MMPKLQVEQERLIQWYRSVRRPLPWRRSPSSAYSIWVSEVMLQQTTVAAVIPYYNRFLEKFPTVASLAAAPEPLVLEAWAGLGYYSRAKNLHKAAKAIAALGDFPKTYQELLELPGFGPYTSRAVASLAFEQQVGVLDGNVIRVISRYRGLKLEWWKPKPRKELQAHADRLALTTHVSDINQGLMELGATICTPKNPSCLLCPWADSCVARAEGRQLKLPLSRPRRKTEIWLWRPFVRIHRNRVQLEENRYAPFLRGHLVPPGQVTRLNKPPKRYHLRGSVTHHDIFIELPTAQNETRSKDSKFSDAADRRLGASVWTHLKDLKSRVPSSLVRKIISESAKFAVVILLAACKAPLKQSDPASATASPTPAPPPAAVEAKPVETTAPPIPNVESLTGPAVALTAHGQNRQPAVSHDGKRVLYASSQRSEHNRSQIYELEIDSKLERRVTFHDGEADGPEYISTTKGGPEKFLYCSDTDEVKELDFSVQAAAQKYGIVSEKTPERQRGEIYMQSLDGRKFDRLTKSLGYDGDPTCDASGKHIAFASNRDGEMRIYIMNAHTTKVGISADKGFRLEKPSLSADGKLLAWQITYESAPGSWLQYSAAPYKTPQNLTNLMVPEGRETASQDLEPNWHPNNHDVVFSSNRGDGKTFNIWLAGTDGQCLKRLTNSTCQERQPVISSDGKYLFFSSDCSGTWQIYRAPLLGNNACWTPPPK